MGDTVLLWGVVLTIINIAAATVVKRDSNFQCTSEGRFPHPDDCGQFYDCIPSSKGELVAHQQSCFGYAFHPIQKSCVNQAMVKDCNLPSTRSLSTADPKLQHLCNITKHNYVCDDCKLLVLCINGEAYTKPCDSGNVCSIKENFGGGVCYPDGVDECTCNEAVIFRKDFYNPSKFLSCGIEGSDPIVHSCPEGLVFNEKTKDCDTEDPVICTSSGTFVVENDCTKYFICIYTTNGWLHKELKCRNHTMFNEETGSCEDPCDWYSGNFTCEVEGRFSNPADCTKYYECIADPLVSGGFSWAEHECPDGHEWKQMMNSSVGHCMTAGTTKEKCVSHKSKNCKVPIEWCTSGDCPEEEGFFRTENTRQCFKFFADQKLKWDQAKTKCEDEDMKLAEPADSEAVALRETLLNKYGNLAYPWMGGRGDGSSMKWQSGGEIPNNSPLWHAHSRSKIDTSQCVTLMVHEQDLRRTPTTPYYAIPCSDPGFPLCERVNTIAPHASSVSTKLTTSVSIISVCSGIDDGFIIAGQCFKMFKDREISWDDAQDKCQEHGLILAQPVDSSAVELRKYIIDMYGEGIVWLGARGDGAKYVWKHGRTETPVMRGNSLWYPGEPRYVDNRNCLRMLTLRYHWGTHPDQPYEDIWCSSTHYTLCQAILE